MTGWTDRLVLIAAECSTPVSEVERMPIDKATRLFEAITRMIRARRTR